MFRTSLALLAFFAAPAAAGVIRVAELPSQAFTSLQAAIDAAPDGGLLLVGGGTYTSATIDGKSLSIVELPGAAAKVSGTLRIANLAAAQSVLLAGLDLRGGTVALALADSAGHVRIQQCTVKGGEVPGPFTEFDGAPAVTVLRCSRVLFAGCSITGGDGHADFGGPGPTGGAGIDSVDGTFALYDCTVKGGGGGAEGCAGGSGGDACRVSGRGLFAFGSSLAGGSGGSGDSLNCCNGGGGGDGLEIALAQAQLLDTPVLAGPGGPSACGVPGGAGQPVVNSGSTVNVVPGTKRKLAGVSLASDQRSLALALQGQRGDRVFLIVSPRSGFAYQPALHGLWGVSQPAFTALLPIGTIGPSGVLALNVQLGAFAAGAAHRPLHFQGLCIDAAGQSTLTSPLEVDLLDRTGGSDCDGDGLNDFVDLLELAGVDCNANLALDVCDLASGLEQDCNGNGTPDSCEIAAGLVPDCDGNGVPDPCDLASGAASDCNANGVLDSCDVAAGASLDVNGNGVPDECELHTPLVLWVDPAAPPGGNGTQASPFDTLQTALAASFHGDTLMLRDGVYAGPANRNLDPAGREIVIRSRNGPAACILDCQFQGRAFSIVSGESSSCRLQGLTIRNGDASTAPHSEFGGAVFVGDARPTIADCVFEDCFARFGGAISSTVAPLRIEGSAFRRCRGVSVPFFPSSGGAIFAGFSTSHAGALPAIVDCEFSECIADSAGAIRIEAPLRTVISHCRFLGNIAVDAGGAIFATSTNSTGQQVFLIEDCWMIGNVAARGGVLWTQSFFCCPTNAVATLSSCTLVENTAQLQGSAIFVQTPAIGGPPIELHNTVLWHNFSPAGDMFFQSGGPATVHVFACDVMGGPASFILGPASTLDYAASNLQVDPQFTDPDGPDNLLATLDDNDFRLGLASPCIDAGDNGLVAPDFADVDHDGDVTEPVPRDLDFLTRFFDMPASPNTGQGVPPLVDLGAYERHP